MEKKDLHVWKEVKGAGVGRIKALRYIKSMRDHASVAFLKQNFSWPYQPSSSLQHVVTSVILKKAVMISRSIFLKKQNTL